MAKYLYILCEGERDEMFYERLAERVTGQSFEADQEFRLRHGSNWKTAIAAAQLLIQRVRRWTSRQDIAVIIAVDNDRAPGHPAATAPARPLPKADQKKEPRYAKLVAMLEEALGKERTNWPVEVALAVPVEMLESWVLTLLAPTRAELPFNLRRRLRADPLAPTRAELPLFSEASSRLAREYHGAKPPPQLKDLCKDAAAASGISLMELFWKAAESDLSAAEHASGSLRLFLEDLQSWTQAEAG